MLRVQAKNFLDFCLTPELATEATLQPIRRFGFDAAILFADILLVPHALGQDLQFLDGEGPVLEAVTDEAALRNLVWNMELLEPVFKTLRMVKKELPDETTLLGFAGAPWTVACYMIDGRGRQGFPRALAAASQNPDFLQHFMTVLHQATLEYLGCQIEAGAEAVQLFDSWAGLLDDQQFRRWVIEPTKKLISALKAEYADIPVIGFPRGTSPENYRAFVLETGVDTLGVDNNIPLAYVRGHLQSVKPVQGNLDPELLVQGGDPMRNAVNDIFKTLNPNHIFNLGHGVLQQTPLEHVAELVKLVRDAQQQPA